MYYQKSELKVKRKTLTAEARIIKVEEQKALQNVRTARLKQKLARAERANATWDSLRNHRVKVVRPEARAAHVAAGFLSGKKYDQIENRIHQSRFGYTVTGTEGSFWKSVVRNVVSFSNENENEVREQLTRWRNAHPQHQKDENFLDLK